MRMTRTHRLTVETHYTQTITGKSLRTTFVLSRAFEWCMIIQNKILWSLTMMMLYINLQTFRLYKNEKVKIPNTARIGLKLGTIVHKHPLNGSWKFQVVWSSGCWDMSKLVRIFNETTDKMQTFRAQTTIASQMLDQFAKFERFLTCYFFRISWCIALSSAMLRSNFDPRHFVDLGFRQNVCAPLSRLVSEWRRALCMVSSESCWCTDVGNHHFESFGASFGFASCRFLNHIWQAYTFWTLFYKKRASLFANA